MNLSPILEAVKQSIMLCREVQHNYLLQNNKFSGDKSEQEPVTIADYGSQAIICRAIREHFPDDKVIAEEAGKQFLELVTGEQRAQILRLLTTTLDQNVTQHDVVHWLDHGKDKESERVWVIDPIDGTKGFLAMRHYAIGVGVLEHGKPTDAIIGCPGYGDGVSGYDEDGAIFYAHDGTAYKMPISGGEAEAISVSSRNVPIKIAQSFEKKHASKSRMGTVRELAGLSDVPVYELDSMEKYALVACGDADLYLRLPNKTSTYSHKVWDHAAGVALVLASGGKATDIDGSELIFSEGRIMPNRGMIISNGVLHDTLIDATQALIAQEAEAN